MQELKTKYFGFGQSIADKIKKMDTLYFSYSAETDAFGLVSSKSLNSVNVQFSEDELVAVQDFFKYAVKFKGESE